MDCNAAAIIQDGYKACRFACLGLGNCERVCPFGAIRIDPAKMIAVVDEDKCQSCGKCVAECPRNILELRPVSQNVNMRCRNAETGRIASQKCSVACIGCERCMKACKFDAITMVGRLPVIDNAKCRHCMVCAEVCPTGAMNAAFEDRLIAEIDKDACIGCGLCKRNCQFGAIEGEMKKPHLVNDACTGCGVCAEKCPKKCITLKVREQDGLCFKDLARTGELLPYEDWRLPAEARAKDLASRLSIEEIAGLMLYSPHQMVPPRAGGPFTGTFGGKTWEDPARRSTRSPTSRSASWSGTTSATS